MNRKNLRDYMELLGAPLLLAVLGLIMAISPDFASGLVGKLIGWLAIAAGALMLLTMLISSGPVGTGGAIRAVLLALLGLTIVRHPQLIAKFLGLILAFVLSGAGLKQMRFARAKREAGFGSAAELLFSLLILAAGVVLFFVPLTASRVIFRVCGLVLLAVGTLRVLLRLRSTRFIEQGSDKRIIDADE